MSRTAEELQNFVSHSECCLNGCLNCECNVKQRCRMRNFILILFRYTSLKDMADHVFPFIFKGESYLVEKEVRYDNDLPILLGDSVASDGPYL